MITREATVTYQALAMRRGQFLSLCELEIMTGYDTETTKTALDELEREADNLNIRIDRRRAVGGDITYKIVCGTKAKRTHDEEQLSLL